MSFISALIGLIVGYVEIVLTGMITDTILLETKKKKVILFSLVKIVLYTVSIIAIFYMPEINVIYLSVAFGAGMVSGCAMFMLIKNRFYENGKKLDAEVKNNEKDKTDKE